MAEPIFLSVREAYDRWSDCYDGYDNPMVFAASHALRTAIATGVAGKRVFEFGCGTGRNLEVLKGAGAATVAGCDVSTGMLGVARRRGLDAELLLHDARARLRVESASFDLALFSLVLEHIEDPREPLREAVRVLHPVGVIAVLEIHPFLSLNGVAAHFQEGGQEIRMPTYPHQFTDYLNVFTELGLVVADCREWKGRDFGEDAPVKALKRGPDQPLLVQFLLRRRG